MATDLFGNPITPTADRVQVSQPRKVEAKPVAQEKPLAIQKAATETPLFVKPEIIEREQADMIRFVEMQVFQLEAPIYQKQVERLFYVTGSEGFKTVTNTVTAYDGDQAFDVASKMWPNVHWYCAAPTVGSVPVVSDNFYRVLGWYELFSTISDIQLMALAHIFASGQGTQLQDQLEAYAKANNLYTTGSQAELVEYIRKAYELNTGYIQPEDLQEHKNVGSQVLNPDLIPF